MHLMVKLEAHEPQCSTDKQFRAIKKTYTKLYTSSSDIRLYVPAKNQLCNPYFTFDKEYMGHHFKNYFL